MNLKFPKKENTGKHKEDNRNIHPKSSVQKCSTMYTNNSLLLTDKNEFPSLSEVSGKTQDNFYSPGGSYLKYSDKLKSTELIKTSQSKPVHKASNNTLHASESVPKLLQHDLTLNRNYKKTSVYSLQNISKEKTLALGKSMKGSLQNVCKIPSSEFSTPKKIIKNNVLKQAMPLKLSDSHSILSAPENLRNSKNTAQSHSSAFDSSSKRLSYKVVATNNHSMNDDGNENSDLKSKKKRKRNSKIKRQATFQSGKITILTPEVHSKILNQSNTSKCHETVTDINNEEEYPELGVCSTPVSLKKNSLKKLGSSLNFENELPEEFSGMHISNKLACKEPDREVVQVPDDENCVKNKMKNNKAVHLNDPITLSIFDILAKDKVKTKILKDEVTATQNVGLRTGKAKKDISHPHNILDSAPALKRGKERENPKPKKPSHLKKIILQDRKIRRDHLLMMKNNVEKKENEHELNISDSESKIEAQFACDLETIVDENLNCLDMLADITTEMYDVSSFKNDCNTICDSLNNVVAREKECVFHIENNQECDILTNEEPKESMQLCEMERKVGLSDSVLKFGKMDISDKAKASKIVLHTRNFRDYCNHLISKDIDDCAFALLDDLARFQDRMHQKDPVKARMKRRMVYGIKEIKKHIKLKKLKCIIIAPDIENVETEGGLNDILNEIKSLSADHRIQCIFALGRKTLGRVCHKPVFVSCVGIFNYEGSEANFKKLIELHSQSLKDYTVLLNKVTLQITEEQASSFIKAKKEAPETLQNLRSNFLRDTFLPSTTEEETSSD